VWEIRVGLEGRCVSRRIRARGRRRIYRYDRFPKIEHTDPAFVLFSEQYSYVDPLPEPIRPSEWGDLVFFARPIHQPGQDYLTGLERALNRSDVPVELRSKSKHRLAWVDVEFLREDVPREWDHAVCGAAYEIGNQEAQRSLTNGIAGGTVGPGASDFSFSGLLAKADATQLVEKWDCQGDPIPKLIDWARFKWGDDLRQLPGRSELLEAFRSQFGHVLGINEGTIREVRRQLAPAEVRRGGAPMHRRQPAK
jgi:hypothetical protein